MEQNNRQTERKNQPSKMTWHDFIIWLSEKAQKLGDLKDAASGSLVYFLYGYFFQKKSIGKGIVSFFIGTLFAMYVSPQVVLWLNLNVNFSSFVLGLLGMRLTEAIINQDYKKIIGDKIQKTTSKD